MWLGEIDASQILDYKFTTRSTTGAPTTLGGTPALSVYKSNSTTESTAGITLTVDFDARTGLNHVRVDTSADGTFYAAGNDFQIVLTAGTVGGTSVVGEVVGHFSIRNRSNLKPATAGRTIVIDAAGLADANMVKLGPSGSGTAQTARDIGASVLLSSGTGTGQILLSSGTVTVGTNNDKTGYSLSQAFPANFSALAITVGGAVTAGTVSDKTGYSLSASQTFNITGNITGNLSGSVGSVTGAVGSVTGAVGSVTAGVTLAANQHVIVDSGTITTVSGQLTAYSSGTGVFSVAALANAPSGGGGGGGDPWATSAPGSYTASQFGGVVYAMSQEVASLLGSTITYSGPVATTGNVSLVRGDDYKNIDGRALTFTNAAGSWPTLTSGSVTFTILTKPLIPNAVPTSVLSQTGTIVAGASGSSQTVRFDLTATQTLQTVGTYQYLVTATLSNGDIVTLASGNLYVVQGKTP